MAYPFHIFQWSRHFFRLDWPLAAECFIQGEANFQEMNKQSVSMLKNLNKWWTWINVSYHHISSDLHFIFTLIILIHIWKLSISTILYQYPRLHCSFYSRTSRRFRSASGSSSFKSWTLEADHELSWGWIQLGEEMMMMMMMMMMMKISRFPQHFHRIFQLGDHWLSGTTGKSHLPPPKKHVSPWCKVLLAASFQRWSLCRLVNFAPSLYEWWVIKKRSWGIHSNLINFERLKLFGFIQKQYPFPTPCVCGCYCLNFHEKSLHPRRLRTERLLSIAFIVACTQSVTWQQWAEWDPSFETASLYTAITVGIFSVHPENFKITTSITDYSCLPIKLQVFRFIR